MNIQKIWEQYCCCDGNTICLVCQANLYYKEYEYVLCKKCLNLDFLAKVRENVCGNLNRLLILSNHFACKIVNQEHYYDDKDWFTREKLFFDLELCLSK